MKQNGFLLIRGVFFALLTLLSFLTLSFASWNISSSLQARQSTSTTSGLIIFESCCFCICTVLAFIEVFGFKANTALISVECGWVAGIALFQLGAAISATINGPLFACHVPASANMCASASLLSPSMWLKSLLSFAYFFSLFITTLAHRELYENIWKESIYTVGWFESGTGRATTKPTRDVEKGKGWDTESMDDENPYSRHLDEIESSSARKRQHQIRNSRETAPWAQAPIRRGKDQPFSVTSSAASSPVIEPQRLSPTPPLNAASSQPPASSRFIEKFRESRMLSRFEIPSLYGNYFHSPVVPTFPSTVADHDQPIPLPRLSEWVRADDIRRT